MVDTKRGPKSSVKSLPAMQFKKGYNKNETCYLAVTRQEDNGGSSNEKVPKKSRRFLMSSRT